MHRSTFVVTWSTCAVLVAAACQDAAPVRAVGADLHSHTSAARSDVVTPEAQRDIDRLRAFTAQFQSFEAAAKAGWGTQITECFSNKRLGGMGFHYGNVALIDGAVDVLEPELLLYEPQKNGELSLVAVEYIVPFTAWTSPQPPQLYGRLFSRNEPFGIWALHVWHELHNPRGVFADWNPKVSCRYAP